MSELTIKARVRRDGTLAIPKQARETLGLHEGDQVEITVNTIAPKPANDPLFELIGIGKGGPADGAEDHDSKLYNRPSA